MATILSQTRISSLTGLPAIYPEAARKEVYEANRHRVYALAFWMTTSEPAAEETTARVFLRAFAAASEPTPELLDRALLCELREQSSLGELSLSVRPSQSVEGVRRNMKRTHLESAVLQLPATEKLIFLLHDVELYGHARIAALLGVTENTSQRGLTQARLRIRELVAQMLD